MFEDRRLGGCPCLYLAKERDDLMLVPETIKKCVVFICYQHEERVKLAGTGFFLAEPSSVNKDQIYPYVVTARHVIEAVQERAIDDKVLIRLNTRDGGTEIISSDVSQWRFHPSEATVDLTAIQWTPDQKKFDYQVIPASMLITDDIVKQHSIGPGDEVFFPGLFVNHYGKKQNLPIIRIGNIAAMAEEPVSTRHCGDIDAHLVEARSIGGLSGSPVFVHLVVGRGQQIVLGAGPTFYLLGLMHGHYDSPLTDKDANVDDGEQAERVNMGIAIVVPSGKIRELIDQDDFRAARILSDKELRKGLAATLD